MNGAAWEVYGEPLGSWTNSRRSGFTWIVQSPQLRPMVASPSRLASRLA
jgi:hypothetical protein